MNNEKHTAKLIAIKQWVLIVAIVGVLLTTGTMTGMLINDRYVVINKTDVNSKNIADLTKVVEKVTSKIEAHFKIGGHDVMRQRMDTIEGDFVEIKADIKEILRRLPR